MRRRDVIILLGSAAIAGPALLGRAFAAWPKDKIIRAVVPFGPGSTIDIIGRIVLDPLASQLGQTIVVENEAVPAAPLVQPQSLNLTQMATHY